jgi:phosphoesterase RecJ-like protein
VKNELREARDLLDRSSAVALIGHVRPDGDTIGSSLALCLSLQQRGIETYPIFSDGISNRFEFLPGSEYIRTKLPETVDLTIAVDTSTRDRMGIELPSGMSVDINIDHHPSNTGYATINLVDPAAASTTELLYQVAEDLTLPIDQGVATNLLAGLITDTLGFRTESTRPASFQMAAELMRFGVNWSELYRRVFVDRSYQAIRYWGRGLMDLDRKDGIVWASLDLQDRASVGYPGWDDGDLIDVLTTIEDAQIAIVFVEQPAGKTKVSWRARSNLDVAKIAAQFGGGGHTLAAGAMIEGTIEQIQSRVITETLTLVDRQQEHTS